LTNATMAYALELANLGWREAAFQNLVLAREAVGGRCRAV